MIVELLRYHLRAGSRDAFTERNERVWTPALRKRPGYVGHELLHDLASPDEVVVLVRWRTRDTMDSFPDELEKELDERMGDLATARERRVLRVVVGED